MQTELEQMNERVIAASGATNAQLEANKRYESEMAKLRRELEEKKINNENMLANLRKKNAEALAELGNHVDQVTKTKSKIDKVSEGRSRLPSYLSRNEVQSKNNSRTPWPQTIRNLSHVETMNACARRWKFNSPICRQKATTRPVVFRTIPTNSNDY
jgi:phage tail tape-measure protein